MNDMGLLDHRKQVTALGIELFRISGVEFSKTTEMQRQACGAFLFGMVFAHGQMNRLAPPDVHALLITVLIDVLKYSEKQAGAFSKDLIRATSAGPNDTMKAIIHRGIDGHRQSISGEHEGLRANLLDIFEALGEPYAR